ncbi:unnamed protein product, partial [Laminaria digitata]
DTLADHSHWVVSLAALPPGIVPECPRGGLVTGCMDKVIRVYDDLGQPQRQLKGHDGGVISFSWTAAGQRELGRDGEDLGRCGRVLRDHARRTRERGVRAWLPGWKGESRGKPSSVATGSTGRQDGGRVVDFQIRIWDESGRQHSGPVRSLDLAPGLPPPPP